MTTASETSSGYKGYKVSTSSQLSAYEGYKAFDKTGWETPAVENNHAWVSGGSKYVAGTGLPDTGAATTSYVGGTATGEYVQLQLPRKIKISKYDYTPRTHTGNDEGKGAPKTVKLLGSNNDGSTWTLIKDITHMGTRPEEGVFYTAQVGATEYYDYIRFVATSTYTDGTSPTFTDVRLSQIRFYGHEEGSGSLDTTLKSVYNVPATTGTQLEVYYDAKDLADGAVTSIEDLSPKSNDGSPTDVSVSDGAFVFNGTSSLMEKTSLSIPGSDNPFTISFWLKNDDFDSNQYILRLGINQTIYQTVAIYKNSSNQIIFASWTLDFPIDYTFTTNQWNHISLVYPGGGWKQSNLIAYIDGRPYTFGGNVSSGGVGGTVLSLATSLTLRLGGFAAGNTHLDGSIANFRLYSKALNADQVKELYDYQKDYFLGSKSQVTLYKGHLGIGVTEPSGQLELAGDERLQEYPPGPMDDYETLIPGHGVFCVSASSQYNSSYAPWKAFRKFWDTDDQSWASFNETVTKETGLPSSTAANFQGILGNWIQLKLPYKIDLHSFKFESRDNVNYAPEELPGAGIVYGSNDEVTWDIVHSFSGVDYGGVSGTLRPVFTVKSNTSYSIFRLLVTKNYLTRSDLRWAGMGAWRLFGTPGPTTLDKGSLSLTRSLNVPRVSRYDVDTETPRPEKLVVDFDTTVNSSPTDISGKGNHGTFVNGASYSPADKAFVFDGTDDVIYTSSATSLPTGDAIYSISAWIKYEGTTGIGVNPVIFAFGSLWDNNKIGNLFLRDGNKLGSDIGGNNIVSTDTVITTNRWYHVVACKVGTENLTTDKIRLYVDGVEIIDKSMNGTSITQALGTSVYVSVGAGFNSQTSPTSPFTGKVSNPKLYNVALEHSEVRKLYNLGRTGRSMVISDTAVGIGKVPEAQLDVRGTANFAGSVGIGTTSPYAKLEISSTTQDSNVAFQNVNQLRINCTNTNSSTGTGGGITFCQRYFSGSDSMIATGGVFGTRLGSINGNYGGGLVFKYKPNGSGPIVEGMVLSSAGKFGIGTDNPGTKLDVLNNAPQVAQFWHTNASRGSYINIRNQTGTLCLIGADGQQFMTQETNSIGLFNTNTGNINYYTNGQRRSYLDSAGRFHAQSFGIYSDERIKDNITDVDDEESLEIIKQLQPKNFVMRENRDVKRWGFIAQDIEQLVPEVVSSDSTSKLYIKKKYEIISYNPPVKLSDVVYSNISVTEYATLDANTQAHYTGPDSGNTYYSNIVSEAVYSKSNVSARITDEVFDIGECVQLSNDETYSLNVCCVNVTSVSNNVYVFQDDCIITADDRNLVDMNLTDYIYVKSKDIDNVKTINYEFIHPTLISAVQQMMRIIDRLTERVTVLENR
jgi:hypothetical protein